jgi:hypothetical protein
LSCKGKYVFIGRLKTKRYFVVKKVYKPSDHNSQDETSQYIAGIVNTQVNTGIAV